MELAPAAARGRRHRRDPARAHRRRRRLDPPVRASRRPHARRGSRRPSPSSCSPVSMSTHRGIWCVTRPPADPRFADPLSGLYWQVGDDRGDLLRSRSLWDTTLALPVDEPAPGEVHRHEVHGPGGAACLSRNGGQPCRRRSARAGARGGRGRSRAGVGGRAPPSRRTSRIALVLLASRARHRDLDPGRPRVAAARCCCAAAWPTSEQDAAVICRPRCRSRFGRSSRRSTRCLMRRNGRSSARAARPPTSPMGSRRRLPRSLRTPARLREHGEHAIAQDIEAVGETMSRHVDRELARARVRGGLRRGAGFSTELAPLVRSLIATLARTPVRYAGRVRAGHRGRTSRSARPDRPRRSSRQPARERRAPCGIARSHRSRSGFARAVDRDRGRRNRDRSDRNWRACSNAAPVLTSVARAPASDWPSFRMFSTPMGGGSSSQAPSSVGSRRPSNPWPWSVRGRPGPRGWCPISVGHGERKDRATQIGQLRKHCSQLRTRYAFGKTCQNLPPLDSIRASDRIEIIRAVRRRQAAGKQMNKAQHIRHEYVGDRAFRSRHLLPAAGPARFGPICGLRLRSPEVRQVPTTAVSGCNNGCTRRACYSITSAARASSVGGTSRPRALAVLRLSRSSNFAWQLNRKYRRICAAQNLDRRIRAARRADRGSPRREMRPPGLTKARVVYIAGSAWLAASEMIDARVVARRKCRRMHDDTDIRLPSRELGEWRRVSIWGCSDRQT